MNQNKLQNTVEPIIILIKSYTTHSQEKGFLITIFN